MLRLSVFKTRPASRPRDRSCHSDLLKLFRLRTSARRKRKGQILQRIIRHISRRKRVDIEPCGVQRFGEGGGINSEAPC
ncbi:hypothetical protein AOLI_G00246890 [Acnodon oligacanthus]